MVPQSTHNHKLRVLKIVQSVLQFKFKHYLPNPSRVHSAGDLGGILPDYSAHLCAHSFKRGALVLGSRETPSSCVFEY